MHCTLLALVTTIAVLFDKAKKHINARERTPDRPVDTKNEALF